MMSILAAAAALATGVGSAQAVPTSFTFTGRLLDDGAPVEGAVTVDLALYSAISGGSPLWEETHDATADDGLVAVPLGGQAPLDPADFDGGDLWLAVTVNGTPLTPRFQLRSVPYAMRAEICDDAEAVGGIPADEVQQVLDSDCSAGSAIRSIDPDGAVSCEPVVAGGAGVPAGAILYFDGACPTGWSDYSALNGRVPIGGTSTGVAVGSPLASGASRTITEVPSHQHSVDPPDTAVSVSTDPGHSHSTSVSTDGSHSHNIYRNTGAGGSLVGGDVYFNLTGSGTYSTLAAGSHSHTVTVNSGGSHGHTASVNLAPMATSAVGSASVDVTMPYLQLRACRKD
jgi:hypothetical protein